MKQEASHVDIKRSTIKQFHKEIWRPLVKGLQNYEMIKDGDKVAVCMSGGKDSILLIKCLRQLKRQSQTDLELEFIVMDPGYNPGNKKLIKDNAVLMNIPVRIFDLDIFDVVMDVKQSFYYLCARTRRGYLYIHARELEYSKIALGHRFDDVIEMILMEILYGGRVDIMTPKLRSTNLQGMELIRPLYYVKEEDILAWEGYDDLYSLQRACRFTERIAEEQAARGMAGEASGIVHTSKRQGMRELIRSLRKTNSFVDVNIMKNVEDTNLDACLGYVKDGIRRRSMDEYDERQKESISHLLSVQIFLKDYERWQVFFMELIKKQIYMNLRKGNVTTQITLDNDFIVPDTLDGMEQVTLGTGEIQVETVKDQGDKVTIKGKLGFQVSYRKESGGLQTLGGSISFEGMVNVRGLEEKDYVGFNWILEDLSMNMINSRKLRAQAIITPQVRAETLKDVEAAVDVDIGSNSRPAGVGMSDTDGTRKVQMEAPKCTASVATIAVGYKDTYRIKEELSLTRGKPNMGRLLWREMKLRDVTVRPLDGKLHLDGELSASVIYGAGDENMSIQQLEETIPFSGGMEMNDVKEDQIPMVTVHLAHEGIEAEPDYDGEVREMDVDAVLGLDIKLYEEGVVGLLNNAYSNNREIELSRLDACFGRVLTRNVCKSRVVERLSLPQAERTLRVCHNEGTIKLDDVEIGDDCPEIDGVSETTLLYLTSDDTSSVQSSAGQVPFRCVVETRGIRKDSVYQLDAKLEQLSTVMIGGDMMEVKAAITLGFLMLQPVYKPVITGAAIHPTDLQKLQGLLGIVGYIMQPGDSLREIAKRLHTTTDNIIFTNELTDDQVKQRQRLLLVKEIAQGLQQRILSEEAGWLQENEVRRVKEIWK